MEFFLINLSRGGYTYSIVLIRSKPSPRRTAGEFAPAPDGALTLGTPVGAFPLGAALACGTGAAFGDADPVGALPPEGAPEAVGDPPDEAGAPTGTEKGASKGGRTKQV